MYSKKTILSVLSVLLVLGLVLGASPVRDDDKERYEEKFEKSVSLARDGKVILRNISGDIEVKVWDKAEVQIRALKVSRTDSEELAKKNFEKVTIEVTQDGDTLKIETKRDKDYFRKGSDKKNVSIDFWLIIPSGAAADMKSVSGDIVMENIGNDVRADTVSGDIDMTGVAGSLKAYAVSGDLTVTGVQEGVNCETVSGELKIRRVKGGADLRTVSGDILLENSEGDVEAEVVSGDIDLIDISGAEEVMSKSVSGSVKFVGGLSKGGSYNFSVLNGDVTLLVPSNSAFELYAKTFSGDINTDFEITLSGKLSKTELRGTVNGGGAEVTLKTFSGDVYLKKR
ncbi:MAG: DUF4097 family beta strand repeat-containing protein [Candidatus Aminicenantaceae bacterium]